MGGSTAALSSVVQANQYGGFGPSPAQSTSGRGQGIHHATVGPGYVPAPNNDFGRPLGPLTSPQAPQQPNNSFNNILSSIGGMFGGYSGGGYGNDDDDLRTPQMPPGINATTSPNQYSIMAPGAQYGGLSGSGFPGGLNGPTPLRDQLVQPTPPTSSMIPPPTETGGGLPVDPYPGTAMNPWGAGGMPDISQMSVDEFLRSIGTDRYLRGMYSLSDWQEARRGAGFNPGAGVDDSYFGY